MTLFELVFLAQKNGNSDVALHYCILKIQVFYLKGTDQLDKEKMLTLLYKLIS